MKKQLIIAAIACAVSGTAFAVPNGPNPPPGGSGGNPIDPNLLPPYPTTTGQDLNIDLTIDTTPPTLTLGGTIFNGSGGTASLDFDNDRISANTIERSIGDVTLNALNYPSGSTVQPSTCAITISGSDGGTLIPDASVVGNPASINYAITKSDGSIIYGHASQASGNPVTTGINSTFSSSSGASSCNINENLKIAIKGIASTSFNRSTQTKWSGVATITGIVQ